MSTLPANVNAADDHASRASGRSLLVLVLAEDAVQRGQQFLRPLVEVRPHQFGGKRADELARLSPRQRKVSSPIGGRDCQPPV